ncbi:hypothetical protein [Kitasatospora sp. NBC_00315]|uniref:hypothetical protein n=1 Tax=Kitasatospora sp. NBC_00315 TaxID=2975963 RepID=UPI003247A2E6
MSAAARIRLAAASVLVAAGLAVAALAQPAPANGVTNRPAADSVGTVQVVPTPSPTATGNDLGWG